MNLRISTDLVGAAFLYLAYVVLAVNATLIETELILGDAGKYTLRAAAFLFLVISLFIKAPSIKIEAFVAITFLLCVALASLNFDTISVIFALFTVIASCAYKERTVLRGLFYSSALNIALVFVLLTLGVTENIVHEFRSRHTYGMNSMGGPTLFYNMLFSFMVLGAIYLDGQPKRWFLVASVISSTYFFTTTDVRGGYASYILFLLLLLFFTPSRKRYIIRALSANIPITLLLIFVLVATLLNNDIGNLILSNRPSLYKNFLEQLTISDFILGTSVKQYDGFSIVDNSYIHLYMAGGVFFFIYFCVKYRDAVSLAFSTRNREIYAFLVASSAYMFSESLLVRVENPFVLYFWFVVFIQMCKPAHQDSPLQVIRSNLRF